MTKTSISVLLTASIIVVISLLSAAGYSSDIALSLDTDLSNDTTDTTITMHGQLLISGMPKEGTKIGILVDGISNGNHIFVDEVTTDSGGHYITFFKLENTMNGTYKVFASSSTSQAGNATAIDYFSIGECTENWICSGWSSCGSDYRKTRTCTDSNYCGTEENKSDLSMSCTPTCATLAGQICTSSESCDGTIIDAADTARCCDGTCRTTGTGTTTTQTTDDEEEYEDEEQEDKGNDTAEVADIPSVNETADDINGTLNDTAAKELNQDDTSDASGEIVDKTPTGRFVASLSQGRWLIVDVILIILIIIFAKGIVSAKKEKADNDTPKKYSFTPKSGKRGFVKRISNIGSIISFSGHAFAHSEKQAKETGIVKLKVMVPEDD